MKKIFNVILVSAMIAAAVVWLYPGGSALLQKIRTHAFIYSYTQPADFEIQNTTLSDLTSEKPALAVPILVYHGIIDSGPAFNNTTRKQFIAQMEMLKRNGYETISVDEFERFREGTFTLPPKPIILTFDDGRKDSYYPVDDVLKKLGFTATMFAATIKADTNDPFYLNWDELRQLKASGRWEIEAHGKRSHDHVIVDAQGDDGRFLTSRIYTPGAGLESVEEYRARVEGDFVAGIADIRDHLGIDAKYFAVPLNSYGALELSNYPDAYDFNVALTKKYFTLAFIQAVSTDTEAQESFYNYADTDPYGLKRLEVKDMSADELLRSLQHYAPKSPALVLPAFGDRSGFLDSSLLLYGRLSTTTGITLATNASSSAARVVFGDWGWHNYSVHTTIVREKGRSASVQVYYTDEDNNLTVDWNDTSVHLIERVGGVERELASIDLSTKTTEADIFISVYNGVVTARFNGHVLADGVITRLPHGEAGFSVWDPSPGAQSTMTSFALSDVSKP